MAALNKFIGIGNLGRDPEARYLPSGDAVTNISVGITDNWKDKTTGEKKEQTEWVRVSFFGKLAEIAGQYLKKGSSIYIEGKLRTRKWTDKDGVEKYATEVVADQMQMLGGRPSDSDEQRNQQAPQQRQHTEQRQPAARQNNPPSGAAFDDDIPF